MKKIIGFFAGITIVALVAALMAVSLRVYNYAERSRIDSILFQPAASHLDRINAPIPLERYSEERIRNHLIVKFATEYLQVFPNREELDSRSGTNGVLRMMSSQPVLQQWRREVLPGLEAMSTRRQMQKIEVSTRGITKPGDYYVVPFTKRIWNNPNDLNSGPVISSGHEMHLKIRFEKGIREVMHGRRFDAGRYLDRGLPPPAIFKFMVDEVIIK